ncbi:hypothetical protein [Burkholderia sp. Ac-20353]|uniref:hypothetical protein n=1 Tax=Burkholderia sp. Ac-20353 TaxID=2703894 RepID=UPI00197C0D73|nr:hypothetical protein [Burkholderia sp. Ac-20353]MBN3785569.1 hypothetical protein [Burkholderia sp. Ac-20353]
MRSAAARIYAVGLDPYCDEVQAARAEAERRARNKATCDRGRELRRKLRETEQLRSGFSVATLDTGIIIGMFFLTTYK